MLLVVHAATADPGQWNFTGSLALARANFPAILLRNGLVLVAGGNTNGNPFVTETAEIYDPSSGTWSPTGGLAQGRDYHTARCCRMVTSWWRVVTAL